MQEPAYRAIIEFCSSVFEESIQVFLALVRGKHSSFRLLAMNKPNKHKGLRVLNFLQVLNVRWVLDCAKTGCFFGLKFTKTFKFFWWSFSLGRVIG